MYLCLSYSPKVGKMAFKTTYIVVSFLKSLGKKSEQRNNKNETEQDEIGGEVSV